MQPTFKRDDNWGKLLIRIGRDRDRVAFKHLFNHFAPLIKGFCVDRANLALSSEAAEELVHETMFSVWQKAPYYDPSRASASAWIFTVARNCRIQLVRRQRQLNDSHELSVDDIWDDPTEDQPFVFLQRPYAEGALNRCLQNLPLEQFHVVKKMYMENKSHNEISAELGLPVGTVKSRARLALKKLQSVHR